MHEGNPPRLMAHILPNNATEFERAMASQVDRMLELDTERIRNLWNPWKCHIDELPYLAWTMSVDIWDPTWDEFKRRSVVARAIRHHSLKGTLGGLEAYAELVGARIVRATVPPAKVFSGASLTREEREAWLSRLPQVRVWRQYERGTAGFRMFFGGANRPSYMTMLPPDGRHPGGAHKHFPHPNDAIHRLRRRARWVVSGQETDARVENFESYFRVFRKGSKPHSAFAGPPLSNILRKTKRFYVPSTAHERVVTIEPRPVSAWRSTVGPSLRPVTSEPEIVAQRSHEGKAVYVGRPLGARYFQPSSAPYRLFERYAVNDGSLIAKSRPTVQFMGVGRYGMKPHTAELKIEIRGKRRAWAAGDGIVTARSRFWVPHNDEPLRKTRSALVSAKRLSDRILLDTTTKPGFIAGLPFWAGDNEFRV